MFSFLPPSNYDYLRTHGETYVVSQIAVNLDERMDVALAENNLGEIKGTLGSEAGIWLSNILLLNSAKFVFVCYSYL